MVLASTDSGALAGRDRDGVGGGKCHKRVSGVCQCPVRTIASLVTATVTSSGSSSKGNVVQPAGVAQLVHGTEGGGGEVRDNVNVVGRRGWEHGQIEFGFVGLRMLIGLRVGHLLMTGASTVPPKIGSAASICNGRLASVGGAL
jgi:hypothetical protein